MLASSFLCLLASTYLVYSAPIITGVKLDPAATAEAQQRDNTATRAFTATQITVSPSYFSAHIIYIYDFHSHFVLDV